MDLGRETRKSLILALRKIERALTRVAPRKFNFPPWCSSVRATNHCSMSSSDDIENHVSLPERNVNVLTASHQPP